MADRTDLVNAMLERLELLAQKSPATGLSSAPPGPRGRLLVESLVENAVIRHAGDLDSALHALQTTFREPVLSTAPSAPGPAPMAMQGLHLHVTPEQEGRYVGAAEGGFEEIGRGGMGRVVLALDRHMGREVAVKELFTGDAHAAQFEAQRQFIREARICARLEHPNVVPVYEVGRRKDGTLYYTMKVIRGRTLASAIEEAQSFDSRLGLLGHYAGVCQAIAYAHSQGVVHGDLKPQNVMIGEFGETIVLDWGGAKLQSATRNPFARAFLDWVEESPLRKHSMLGTPLYMSPELAAGDASGVNERSDVWALGVVLYELLTGQYPFYAGSIAELIPKIVGGQYVPVQRHVLGVSPALGAIVDRALARDPSSRYSSARELMLDIELYRTGGRVGSYAYSSLELVARFVERNRAAFTVAMASLLLLASLAVTSYRGVAQSRDRAVAAERLAVANEKRALHHLAEVFTTQATVAQAQGDVVAASLFAAHALAIEERPDARGYAVGLAGAVRWNPGQSFASCGSAARASDGTFACLRDSQLELHRGAEVLTLATAVSASSHLIVSDAGNTVVRFDDSGGQAFLRVTQGRYEASAVPLPGTLSAAVAVDGSTWALGTRNGRILVRRGAAPLFDIEFGEPVVSLALASGRTLFAGGRFGRLLKFALPESAVPVGVAPAELRTTVFNGHSGTVTALGIAGNNSVLASSSADRTVRLWPLGAEGGEGVASKIISDDTASAIALSNDARFVAHSTPDYAIRIYDVAHQRYIGKFRGHDSPLQQLTFTDSLDLFSSSSDQPGKTWSYQLPTHPAELISRTNVLAVVGFDDGKSLVSAGVGATGVCLWDTATERCKTRLPAAVDTVRALAISPDRSRLGIAGAKGYAILWDIKRGLPASVLLGHSADVRSIVFSHDGQRVLTASLDGTVREWDAATGTQLRQLAMPSAASAARYSNAGSRIAVALRSGTVAILDTHDFRQLTELGAASDWVTDVVFSGDDRRIVAGYADRAVRIYESDTARLVGTLGGFGGRVLSIAVSPDQKWLGVGGEEPVVRLYNFETLELAARLEHHSADVRAVTFSDAGAYLISASDDHSIRYWSLSGMTTDGSAWAQDLERTQKVTLSGTTLAPSER